MTINKKVVLIVGGLLLLFVVVPLSWVAVESGIQATAGERFCGSCHVMQPMVAAYRESVHGGNNAVGFKAECTACHVSHANPMAYLWSKSVSGTTDLLVTWFSDETTIDWQANRARHDEYVYDSGCLKCHSDLAAVAPGPHKAYFAGTITAQCVDCHADVGHHNLNKYLLAGKYSR